MLSKLIEKRCQLSPTKPPPLSVRAEGPDSKDGQGVAARRGQAQLQCLAEAGAVALVGSTSDSYENALAEYVDWFNHRRLHGEIGLVPPAEFEDNFYRQESVSAHDEALVPSL